MPMPERLRDEPVPATTAAAAGPRRRRRSVGAPRPPPPRLARCARRRPTISPRATPWATAAFANGVALFDEGRYVEARRAFESVATARRRARARKQRCYAARATPSSERAAARASMQFEQVTARYPGTASALEGDLAGRGLLQVADRDRPGAVAATSCTAPRRATRSGPRRGARSPRGRDPRDGRSPRRRHHVPPRAASGPRRRRSARRHLRRSLPSDTRVHRSTRPRSSAMVSPRATYPPMKPNGCDSRLRAPTRSSRFVIPEGDDPRRGQRVSSCWRRARARDRCAPSRSAGLALRA